jgi:hypothetical protein
VRCERGSSAKHSAERRRRRRKSSAKHREEGGGFWLFKVAVSVMGVAFFLYRVIGENGACVTHNF